MYQTLKIESLSKMIPFFKFPAVEKISVDAVKYNFISMKVDHMKGVVLFGNLVSNPCILSLVILLAKGNYNQLLVF